MFGISFTQTQGCHTDNLLAGTLACLTLALTSSSSTFLLMMSRSEELQLLLLFHPFPPLHLHPGVRSCSCGVTGEGRIIGGQNVQVTWWNKPQSAYFSACLLIKLRHLQLASVYLAVNWHKLGKMLNVKFWQLMAPQVGAHPWMAAISRGTNSFYCGASLVAR